MGDAERISEEERTIRRLMELNDLPREYVIDMLPVHIARAYDAGFSLVAQIMAYPLRAMTWTMRAFIRFVHREHTGRG